MLGKALDMIDSARPPLVVLENVRGFKAGQGEHITVGGRTACLKSVTQGSNHRCWARIVLVYRRSAKGYTWLLSVKIVRIW